MDKRFIRIFNNKKDVAKDKVFALAASANLPGAYGEAVQNINEMAQIFEHFINEDKEFRNSIAEEQGKSYLELLDDVVEYKKAVHFLLALVDNEKLEKYPLNIKKIQRKAGL